MEQKYSFLQVLQLIETGHISPLLNGLLQTVHERLPALELRYRQIGEMQACLDDVDVYLTVGRSLLAGSAVEPLWARNLPSVESLLAMIDAKQPVELALFSRESRYIDFSQFEVRGYYTRTEVLRRYFRCMMWLGRIDFRLSPVPEDPRTHPRTQEVVDAFLLHELIDQADVRDGLSDIDQIIRTFVGHPDNTTLEDLDRLVAATGLPSAANLWDAPWMLAIGEELASGDYEPQAINSRILMIDPLEADPVQLPFAFLLMGQRFVLDSHVFGSVVYDRIVVDGVADLAEVLSPGQRAELLELAHRFHGGGHPPLH